MFQFKPKTLTVIHNSKMKGLSAGGSSSGPQLVSSLTDLGLPSLSLPGMTFDGPDTLARCEQLLAWSYAVSPPEGGTAAQPALPPLIFQWGEFTMRKEGKIPVTLTKVDIVYERFSASGKPTRATVSLDLEPSTPATPGQQNPTSGGLPGRSGHVMISGESLPGIALGAYGNPGDWRRLAAANQLDDPLRVRPGAVLYVPSQDELAGGGVA